MKPTPTQADVRASLRGRLEDVIEELEAVRGVMRDELGGLALSDDVHDAEKLLRHATEWLR